MRKQLGDRLPEWTPEEVELVKGSNDFYGMNHYCANYIRHKDTEPELDDHAGNLEILYQNKKGEWIGPETQSVWLRPMPLGFRKLIKWLSDRYGGPTFYVTENGTSLKGENDLPLEELLNDEFRVEYFRGYVGALADAHAFDGVDVRGYSAWSLMEYVNVPFLPSITLTSISYAKALSFQAPCCAVELAPMRFSTSIPRSEICLFFRALDCFVLPRVNFANCIPATSNGPRATRRDLALPTLTTRAARSATPRRARAKSRRSSISISKRSRQFRYAGSQHGCGVNEK